MRLMSGSAAPVSAARGAFAGFWHWQPPRRRGRTWLALAAAAIAVAVAVTLVTVTNAPPPAVSATGVPEYYVALPPVPELGFFSSSARAVVGDTLTGKRVATVPAPAGLGFAGVTALSPDGTMLAIATEGSASD
jgi:hypothetical protein